MYGVAAAKTIRLGGGSVAGGGGGGGGGGAAVGSVLLRRLRRLSPPLLLMFPMKDQIFRETQMIKSRGVLVSVSGSEIRGLLE